MCMFDNPEQHAANPPETWKVVKVADHMWCLTVGDADLDVFHTRKAALLALTEGRWFDQYHKEGRWYAGEEIPGWKSWAQVLAEHNRHLEWLERRAREIAERRPSERR